MSFLNLGDFRPRERRARITNMDIYHSYIDGAWVKGEKERDIRSPYSGEVVSRVAIAGEAEVESALKSATQAFDTTRNLPAYKRSELLLTLREGVLSRKEDFVRSIALEAGKPITDSRVEVDRALNVLTLCTEEA